MVDFYSESNFRSHVTIRDEEYENKNKNKSLKNGSSAKKFKHKKNMVALAA